MILKKTKPWGRQQIGSRRGKNFKKNVFKNASPELQSTKQK